jgi:hypothetical protein
MRRAVAAFALLALLVQNGLAQNAARGTNVDAGQNLTLALPRPLAAGETAAIEVQVGPISRGRQITVTTATGEPLGTISPFGTRAGQDAGTFSLPVPAEAIRDGRIAIRITISQAGAPARAPTTQEVRAVKVTVGGGAPR